MNTIPYGTPQPDFESYQEEPFELPQRPRRHFWGPATTALITVIAGAACFYAGVRVEKGQSSSTPTAAAGALARLAGAGAAGGAGARATAGTGASGPAGAAGVGTTGAGLGGGGFGRFARGAGGGNSSFGTVSAIDGQTIYLTDITGNTIKVTLSSATKITKSQSASASDLRPGDSVVISGIKGSGGTIAAATVSDSGARTTGGGGGSGSGGSGSSRSTSSGSAVNSLFGGGGG